MQSLINFAAGKSRLRIKAINALCGMVKDEVLRQREEGGNGQEMLKVLVPAWLHRALRLVEGQDPTILGLPLEVGKHDEIHVLFRDITMSPATQDDAARSSE